MGITLEDIYGNPIFQALNPEGKEFLEVRWLPKELNPFHDYEVKVGAVVLKRFPHIKTVPTVQMMLEDFNSGLYEGKHTIVVPSSGNTAYAVARLAPAFGFKEVKVVLSVDVPSSKKDILYALSSVDVIGVSGGKSVEDRAKRIVAEQSGHILLDQYSHMGNLRAHERFTGPEIARVLGDNIAFIAIAMGSGGTLAGVGKFFHQEYRWTRMLGVQPHLGERVPGTRDKERMDEVVTLPWKTSVDFVVTVSRKRSFISTRELSTAVEPQPGPSSGLAYGGLMQYLGILNKKEIEKLRGKCVGFLCPDGAAPYSALMSAELDTGQGFPISI